MENEDGALTLWKPGRRLKRNEAVVLGNIGGTTYLPLLPANFGLYLHENLYL